MNKISILFFATLKDLAGTSKLDLEIPEEFNILALKNQLNAQIPSMETHLINSIASINQEFAYDNDLIPAKAEIAFFPPVSGGSEFLSIIKITREPINIDEITAQLTKNSTGGICIFTGIVRGETHRGDSHLTSSLEYEAYIPMAESKMYQVAEEIRRQWPSVEGVVIIQRIGLLAPGTPTILIACAAAHRDTGIFEAAHYGIDRLKKIVPVWKKEIGPNGETWVEGDYIPRKGD
jgi:MoaE-MoaD fusion protein